MTLAATPERLSRIRLVAFDVDGVFTDGRFYLSDEGIETKCFHTQDGFGVRRLLASGVEVAIISGRQSRAVEIRMRELGVRHVALGCKDKVVAMTELLGRLGIEASQCAFVGDDVPDLPLLRYVGLSVAVANAVPEVLAACDCATVAAGGFGAVREVCDWLVGRGSSS